MLLIINHNRLIMFVIIGIRYAKENITKECTKITNVLETELPIIVCKGIEKKSLHSHPSSHNKCKAEKVKLDKETSLKLLYANCILKQNCSRRDYLKKLHPNPKSLNDFNDLSCVYSTGIKKQSLLQYIYKFWAGVHFYSRNVEPQSLVVAENI